MVFLIGRPQSVLMRVCVQKHNRLICIRPNHRDCCVAQIPSWFHGAGGGRSTRRASIERDQKVASLPTGRFDISFDACAGMKTRQSPRGNKWMTAGPYRRGTWRGRQSAACTRRTQRPPPPKGLHPFSFQLNLSRVGHTKIPYTP
jgi:hypothetical protein